MRKKSFLSCLDMRGWCYGAMVRIFVLKVKLVGVVDGYIERGG